eukprot:g36151.t1
MVSHQNFVSLVAALNIFISNTMDVKDLVWLAYLPLAHILELASEVFMLAIGAKVGYSYPRTLMDDAVYDETGKGLGDIRALSVTMMPASLPCKHHGLAGHRVPLVLDRIRAGIEAKVAKAGLVVRLLFKAAPVALLAPNETNLKKYAKEHDIPEADDLEALCKNATIKKAVMDDLISLGTSSKIQKCEYPADISFATSHGLPKMAC